MSNSTSRWLIRALGGSTKTSYPTTSQQDPLFPMLPLELRYKIYEYIILPSTHMSGPLKVQVNANYSGSSIMSPNWFPAFINVKKATRIEAGLFFLSISELEIRYVAWPGLHHLSHLLNTFPGTQGFEAIRRLYFPLFGEQGFVVGSVNAGIEFMKKCTKLGETTIKFNIRNLANKKKWKIKGDDSPGEGDRASDNHVLALDQVVGKYELEGLFELDSLHKITIEVHPVVRLYGLRGRATILIDCMPVILELAEWLRLGFEKRRRNIEVSA